MTIKAAACLTLRPCRYFNISRLSLIVLILCTLTYAVMGSAWELSQVITKGDMGIDGLLHADKVEVSNDDRHIYVLGSKTLKTLERSADGALNCVQIIDLSVMLRDEGYRWARGMIVSNDDQQVMFFDRRDEGYRWARGMIVSNDDQQVFVTGGGDYELIVFDRKNSGLLTFNSKMNGAGFNRGGYDITASHDNRHVYVSRLQSLAVFDRNSLTGNLSAGQLFEHTPSVWGSANVSSSQIEITFDDKQVLVANDVTRIFGYSNPIRIYEHRLLIYDRSATTGVLQYRTTITQPQSRRYYIRDIKASLDNRQIYVSGYGGRDSLAIFDRALPSGAVTLNKYITSNELGNFRFAPILYDIVPSQDNAKLYALWAGVRVLARNPSSGRVWYDSESSDRLVAANNLSSLSGINLSRNGHSIYVTGCSQPECPYSSNANALGVINYFPDNRTYSYDRTYKQQEDQIGILDKPQGLAYSPDDKQLYLTVLDDDALKVFTRMPGGHLQCVQVIKNGQDGVEGLLGPTDVDASLDNKQVFVTGRDSDSLVVFDHDVVSGQLTFNTYFTSRWRYGAPRVAGLGGASGVEITYDDLQVLVAGREDNSLVVFDRHPNNGTLTHKESFKWKNYANPGGIDGLYQPTSIKASQDNKSVYVTADNALVAFSRVPDTGSLTFSELLKARSHWSPNGIDGVTGANSIAISKNDRQAFLAGGAPYYVRGNTAGYNGTLAHFQRNPVSGDLTLNRVLREGLSGNDKVSVSTADISPDDRQVFSTGSNGLAVFHQPSEDSALMFEDVYQPHQARFNASVNGVDALTGLKNVKVSPGGDMLAIVSWALVVFKRPSCLFEIPFLYQTQNENSETILKAYLTDELGYSYETVSFRIYFDDVRQECLMEATLGDFSSAQVALTALKPINENYVAGQLRFPLSELNSYQRNYLVLLNSKIRCNMQGRCETGVSISGRAYSIVSDDGVNNLKAEDFFLRQGVKKTLKPDFMDENIQPADSIVTKRDVNSCAELQSALSEIGFAGTIRYQSGQSRETEQQAISNMSSLNIQCLRTENGHFQLFADVLLPVSFSADSAIAAAPGSQMIRSMLTAYYQPGDEQLTWYGVEVRLNDTGGSGNTTTPFLVPTTSVVLEQALSP